jgi:hypothetical protein
MIKYSQTSPYNKFINNAPDDFVWKPIKEDEIFHFNSLLEKTKEAVKGDDKKLKGDTLEDLMTFIYQRFDEVAEVYPNQHHGDNQIDHIIEFQDGLVPNFIHNYLGMRLIGESKNHKKSISVREVADLNELLRSKRAKFGVFSSIKSFSRGKSGNPWVHAEGKRRKLNLSNDVAILGFTLNELESLKDKNFYTLLKQKFFSLVDEIDDDFTDLKKEDYMIPYHERLYLSMVQLNNEGIISDEELRKGTQTIIKKYGDL